MKPMKDRGYFRIRRNGAIKAHSQPGTLIQLKFTITLAIVLGKLALPEVDLSTP
jgi:hypothetical protein